MDKPKTRKVIPPFKTLFAAFIVLLVSISACSDALESQPVTPTAPPLATELTIYNWADALPTEIFDAFKAEYGVTIKPVAYEASEDVVANMQAGEVYDVVVIGNSYVNQLREGGLLAPLTYANIPNAKNIAANFRDMAYDPGNKHIIPWDWGTTGLVVRNDLVEEPITKWSDLWDSRYAGKIGVWNDRRTTIGLALQSLGYSANSEDPAELEAARQRLLELRPHVIFLESIDPWTSAPALADGTVVLAFGWAFDALAGMELNENISYVIAQEGTILWGENLVIPANSPHKYTAEVFINFLLRPEISGQYVNYAYYAIANEAARPYIDEDVLANPVIFPTTEMLENAEIILPLSIEAQAIYADIWAEFMAANEG